MMRAPLFLVASLSIVWLGCGEQPTPTADKASATPAKTTASASAKPVAEKPTATATATASAAAPEASASAASSASAGPLVPSETPASAPPSDEEWQKLDKEIAVKASGEQKCSTKVLKGWFELSCGPADGLVRATKVEILSGFDAKSAVLETPEKGVSMRWVAALPATGEKSQARLTGAKLHEIFLTLENTDKGWKGQLSGKKPE